MNHSAFHGWLPWIQVPLYTLMLIAMIWRKRTGRWKRPPTFKWAMLLMTTGIVLAATAAVLELYEK